MQFGAFASGILHGFGRESARQEESQQAREREDFANQLGFWTELLRRPDLTPEGRAYAYDQVATAYEGKGKQKPGFGGVRRGGGKNQFNIADAMRALDREQTVRQEPIRVPGQPAQIQGAAGPVEGRTPERTFTAPGGFQSRYFYDPVQVQREEETRKIDQGEQQRQKALAWVETQGFDEYTKSQIKAMLITGQGIPSPPAQRGRQAEIPSTSEIDQIEGEAIRMFPNDPVRAQEYIQDRLREGAEQRTKEQEQKAAESTALIGQRNRANSPKDAKAKGLTGENARMIANSARERAGQLYVQNLPPGTDKSEYVDGYTGKIKWFKIPAGAIDRYYRQVLEEYGLTPAAINAAISGGGAGSGRIDPNELE